MLEFARGLAVLPTPKGENVLILTGAGGSGVLLSDACADNGLTLMTMPEDLDAALATDGPEPLVGLLKDRTRTSIITAAPDRLWEETWMRWAMFVLAGVLCVEWLLRRILKLA